MVYNCLLNLYGLVSVWYRVVILILITSDQKKGMQAISKGEGAGWSGRKRKSQPLPERKSVRAAAEEFLAKASQELIGYNGSGVKGPVRLVLDEDED